MTSELISVLLKAEADTAWLGSQLARASTSDYLAPPRGRAPWTPALQTPAVQTNTLNASTPDPRTPHSNTSHLSNLDFSTPKLAP